MDELIATSRRRRRASIGATAEKAVGIILDFLVKEGPADKVQPLLAKLPGAEALMQKAASEGGGRMGGLMGAGMRMMAAGLSMGQVQASPGSHRLCTRESGEDAIGEIVGAIPALRSSFEYGNGVAATSCAEEEHRWRIPLPISRASGPT